MMDRKFSDPTIYDNSIDWDDEPDGSDGGYDRHGNYINSSAMMELVALRAQLAATQQRLAECEAAGEKQIRMLANAGVDRLNEIAPDQGWDSGDTVAEMYIRDLKVAIDKAMGGG